MEMVAVGMRLAGEHLSDDHMFETAFYGFDFFNTFHLESGEGEQFVELLRREFAIVDIVF